MRVRAHGAHVAAVAEAKRIPAPHNPFREVSLIVDTGSTRTVVSELIFAASGVPPISTVEMETPSGPITFPEYLCELEIEGDGGVYQREMRIAAFDRPPTWSEGVLGLDVLREGTLELDLAASLGALWLP